MQEEFDVKNYIETSSKTGYNSKQLFIDVAKLLYNDFLSYKNQPSVSTYSKASSNINFNNNRLDIKSNNELLNGEDIKKKYSTSKKKDDSFKIKKKGCC